MKRKRLDRDLKWEFQYFPYYQTRLDCDIYHGLVNLITLTDGEYFYWEFPKAGKTAVCGKGGDNLDHSQWQPRSISGKTRLDDKSKIALLAFELGLKIKNH